MNILLTVIGILGLGALLISTWIFAAAARRYVTGESRREKRAALDSDLSPYRRPWIERSPQDRRSSDAPVSFPLQIDDLRIEVDRRMNPDRRRAA